MSTTLNTGNLIPAGFYVVPNPDPTQPDNLVLDGAALDARIDARITASKAVAANAGSPVAVVPVAAPVATAPRKLLDTDRTVAYSLNQQVSANGTVSAPDASKASVGCYNLALPAGVDGWAAFRVPTTKRSARLQFLAQPQLPPPTSWQLLVGARLNYGALQTSSGDGKGMAQDWAGPQLKAEDWVFVERVGKSIRYSVGTQANGSDRVQCDAHADPTGGSLLVLAIAGEAADDGGSALPEVYTFNFIPAATI